MNAHPHAAPTDPRVGEITLVLVRHAKSDWSEPGLADHDRPLNGRGTRDAPRMAALLAQSGFRPDLILSSTAVRARMTADALSSALDVAVTLVPNLYGASANTLLAQAAANSSCAVILVAHDPGMSDLAEGLSGGGITHMPTCAIATFTWNTDSWDATTAMAPDSWSLDTPR